MRDGWREVTFPQDKPAYEQLLTGYSPNPLLQEYKFDAADPGDIVYILWVQNEPAGFCTLKPKGCCIEEWMETYAMLTLDTIYLLPQYRRRGFVLSLLEQLMGQSEVEHMGFSSPLSNGMYGVVGSFLRSHPQYRNRLWEIQYGGNEGDRELIWYKMRRRNLIHTAGA